MSAEKWWELCDRGGWSKPFRDAHSTLVRASKSCREFNRVYREQMDSKGYFMATVRHGARNFQVQWDYWDFEHPRVTPDSRDAHTAFRRFALELLRSGRVRLIAPGWKGYGSLDGFRDEDEARTAEILVGEAFANNPCGTVRAVWALAGRDLDQLYAEGGDPERAWFPDMAARPDTGGAR